MTRCGYTEWILNHLSDILFDIYLHIKSTKEIWNDLEKKYGVQDVGMNKYTAKQFLGFNIELRASMGKMREKKLNKIIEI
ncbi:hypothetical protein I3842_08G126000 [Carya illinoinensis]|uniref:Uncharacterized protein n=1 Tax=Carya illinoinensis TaxID=32201 RepID=A0A922ECK4_CARIL|nr:hypothetical protein I3842_08G126000 [Carya illinoinensis]